MGEGNMIQAITEETLPKDSTVQSLDDITFETFSSTDTFEITPEVEQLVKEFGEYAATLRPEVVEVPVESLDDRESKLEIYVPKLKMKDNHILYFKGKVDNFELPIGGSIRLNDKYLLVDVKPVNGWIEEDRIWTIGSYIKRVDTAIEERGILIEECERTLPLLGATVAHELLQQQGKVLPESTYKKIITGTLSDHYLTDDSLPLIFRNPDEYMAEALGRKLFCSLQAKKDVLYADIVHLDQFYQGDIE